MMDRTTLHRLTAFTTDPSGGNPAGVWLGDEFPDEERMLEIAADVGYSETVFAVPTGADFRVRYFSPAREIPFCGHATIALGVLLGDHIAPGRYRLNTAAGMVPVTVAAAVGGFVATLTSVEPHSESAPDGLVAAALRSLGWSADELDGELVPAVAYAGAKHLIIAVAERSHLANVSYDFESMKALMLEADLTTVNLVWRESPTVYHSRNLFPVGGVVEDPATGAAAAALGGHLRALGLIESPSAFTIHQGVDMGRPSRIEVHVPSTGGIDVTGSAVPMP